MVWLFWLYVFDVFRFRILGFRATFWARVGWRQDLDMCFCGEPQASPAMKRASSPQCDESLGAVWNWKSAILRVLRSPMVGSGNGKPLWVTVCPSKMLPPFQQWLSLPGKLQKKPKLVSLPKLGVGLRLIPEGLAEINAKASRMFCSEMVWVLRRYQHIHNGPIGWWVSSNSNHYLRMGVPGLPIWQTSQGQWWAMAVHTKVDRRE